MPRRIIEPLLEALELLLGADVEKEFDDARTVGAEHLLKVVDQIVAFRPHGFRDQLVHARDQDVLVVRSVENHDVSLAWRVLMDPPEEIVSGLKDRRLLEAKDEGSLRIHSIEYVAHDAILAAGIERLQDHQE